MSESMVEIVAEAMWQAEWARAGNGGRRKVPWSEISELDQERYRFVARAVLEVMKPKRTVDDLKRAPAEWQPLSPPPGDGQ